MGNGFGSVKVGPAGGVSFIGVLGDRTPVTQTSFMSANGQWPLFAPLYSGKGLILGWLTFTTQGYVAVGGPVTWIRLPHPNAASYPGGFTNQSAVIGSGYSFTKGFPILNLNPGVVVLQNGSHSVTNQFSLSANNVLTGPDNLNVTINPASGWFEGHALDPATGKPVFIQGAVLQSQTAGFGYYTEAGQIGSVWLGPD
jgi:hypothetical protein